MTRSNARNLSLLAAFVSGALVSGCAGSAQQSPPPQAAANAESGAGAQSGTDGAAASSSSAPRTADAGARAPTPAAADPWAGRTDLIVPPTASPARDVDLGTVVVEKLANGLTVLLVPRNDLPIINVSASVAAGSLDDPDGKSGLFDLLAETLVRGSKKYTGPQIAETIEQRGGSIEAGATAEGINIGCRALAKDAGTCLDLVADVTQNPTFPEAEIEVVRDRLLGLAVKSTLDEPSQLADEHIANALFGDSHPHGSITTEASLKAVDRAALVRTHAAWFVPANTYVVVAGSFEAEAMKAEVKKRFGGWKKAAVPTRPTAVLKEPQGVRVLLIDKPGLNQAQIRIAHGGIAHSDEDHVVVTLMNAILGGSGFSSRLMKVIRAEKGKTYGIRSRFEMLKERGGFYVSTFTRTAEVVRTIDDVLAEIARYRSEGPTEEELVRIKGHVTGQYPIQLQQPSAVAAAVLNALVHGFDVEYVKSYARKLDALTRADVAEAAAKHLDPANVAVVIVGDGAQLEPALQKAKLTYERIPFDAPISRREREAVTAGGAKSP